jgi:hypothetical protein
MKLNKMIKTFLKIKSRHLSSKFKIINLLININSIDFKIKIKKNKTIRLSKIQMNLK